MKTQNGVWALPPTLAALLLLPLSGCSAGADDGRSRAPSDDPVQVAEATPKPTTPHAGGGAPNAPAPSNSSTRTPDAGSSGDSTSPSTCNAEECLDDRPCQIEDDCPDDATGYYYSKRCLPQVCGEPPVCRYGPLSAAPPIPVLVCSCDGQVTVSSSSTVPSVSAYQLADALYSLCSCGSSGTCDFPPCEALTCDPTNAPPSTLRAELRGEVLGLPDGTKLRAFDRFDAEVGVAVVAAGTVSTNLLQVPANLYVLVDGNDDGNCNPGEVLLPHSLDFRFEQSLAVYTLDPRANPQPCENELVVTTPEAPDAG